MRVIVALVLATVTGLAAAGCRSRTATELPGDGPPPLRQATPAATAGETTPPVAEARPAPETAVVQGTARDAKGGAVIELRSGRVIYVAGLSAWPDELRDRDVRAEGLLVLEPYLPQAEVGPDGAISTGTDGGQQWVLRDATWAAE